MVNLVVNFDQVQKRPDLSVLSYLAGSESISVRPFACPFGPEMIAITAQEPSASSSGKNVKFKKNFRAYRRPMAHHT